MHWDGQRWSWERSAIEGRRADLWEADAVDESHVWAVGEFGYPQGQGGVLSFDGATWTRPDVPLTRERSWLRGVAAVPHDEVWAVGAKYENSAQRPLVLRWDGTTWQTEGVPQLGDQNWLTGIDGGPDGELWVCGFYQTPTFYEAAFVLRGI